MKNRGTTVVHQHMLLHQVNTNQALLRLPPRHTSGTPAYRSPRKQTEHHQPLCHPETKHHHLIIQCPLLVQTCISDALNRSQKQQFSHQCITEIHKILAECILYHYYTSKLWSVLHGKPSLKEICAKVTYIAGNSTLNIWVASVVFSGEGKKTTG